MKTLLVIFGITGDLSTRKLLPALSHIIHADDAPDLTILGVSRREVDLNEVITQSTHDDSLAERTSLLTMDVAHLDDYRKLKKAIQDTGADQTLIYLSVPPGAAAQIVDLLGEAGVNAPNIHLLFEKPFGFDLASAHDFIERTGRYFKEEQLYRIDHYMAKEVAAEIVRLRRGAEAKHHHWGADAIESVTIVASEMIGIEGRAQFYEQTGALRDFIQGHLLQLLSLVLMTRPTLDESLPAQRLRALQSIDLASADFAVRGQYEGYQDEAQNPGSTVETFVALELRSSDENWHGVPLRLVTGKALDEKRSYITIKFKDGTSLEFEEGRTSTTVGRSLDAYERVLLEAIAGRKELFTSSEEVIRAWEILAPVQYAWEMAEGPTPLYKKGTHYTTVFSH